MIQDSGDRTEYPTGAVRDIKEGKGRCDLMPLDVVGELLSDKIIKCIYKFQQDNNTDYLFETLLLVANEWHSNEDYGTTEVQNVSDMFLDVSIHFEEGAKKYGEYNWQKGIPVHSYIDSAVRHYLKYLRGDEDENHLRAFVWNILCCIWTVKNIDVKEDK